MRVSISQLAKARERRGLTQKALGEATGLKPATIASIENFHIRPWPRFRRQAARFLGVPESELFPAAEDPRAR